MKKTLSMLTIMLALSGTASAQSVLSIKNGEFLITTTMMSIKVAAQQFQKEHNQRQEITKKREQNRKNKAERLALEQRLNLQPEIKISQADIN